MKDKQEQYLRESIVLPHKIQDGSLDWWLIHYLEYPDLSKLVRNFSSISGTGIPIKTLFDWS